MIPVWGEMFWSRKVAGGVSSDELSEKLRELLVLRGDVTLKNKKNDKWFRLSPRRSFQKMDFRTACKRRDDETWLMVSSRVNGGGVIGVLVSILLIFLIPNDTSKAIAFLFLGMYFYIIISWNLGLERVFDDVCSQLGDQYTR